MLAAFSRGGFISYYTSESGDRKLRFRSLQRTSYISPIVPVHNFSSSAEISFLPSFSSSLPLLFSSFSSSLPARGLPWELSGTAKFCPNKRHQIGHSPLLLPFGLAGSYCGAPLARLFAKEPAKQHTGSWVCHPEVLRRLEQNIIDRRTGASTRALDPLNPSSRIVPIWHTSSHVASRHTTTYRQGLLERVGGT